ncbi:MAG: DUF1801 domain-containing protein [bacterium]|nr:DUF1801 domain-containing protein [bacterium]
MNARRADGDELAQLLQGFSDEVCDLVMELRDLVLSTAPEATERILWKGLSYHKAHEGGPVKGAICQIGLQEDCVHLAFIHGASLPDPEGLLQGDRKAKRFVPIRCRIEIHQSAVKNLICAAVAYRPGQ